MPRGAFFSLCLLSFACSYTPGTAEPEVEEGNLPLHTHDLQVDPGCYVSQTPPVENGAGAVGAGDMLEQMTEFQELNMSMNMQYQLQSMMLFNSLIQSDPTADFWELDQTTTGGQRYHVRIEPRARGERTSQFEITWDRTIAVATGPIGSPPEWVETTVTGYGTATPHTTTVELGPTVFRWSDNAWEIRSVEMVGVVVDDAWQFERHVISHLRGCDPHTLVSFGNRAGGAIDCWTLHGYSTDCEHIDLWP